MTTCANCSNEAFFSYVVTKTFAIPYCSKHLPKFLDRMSASLVKIQKTNSKPVSKKKKLEPELPLEPIFEEPVVDFTENSVNEDLGIPVIESLEDEGELEVDEGK